MLCSEVYEYLYESVLREGQMGTAFQDIDCIVSNEMHLCEGSEREYFIYLLIRTAAAQHGVIIK